jgi:hypothetical protein
MQQLVYRYNSGTRARPRDVGLWLRFAEFQTELQTLTVGLHKFESS